MPLIEFKTSLKSLKFGKDRPYGGSSNQPYIQTSIPEGENSGVFQTGGPDFILRGGILAPISAAKDVSRLTQMFFDLKSPNGSLFIAKQNVLSRTSVETEASTGAGYAAGAVNQGVYLPSSTLAQAGVGFTGTHLNLLGIDPSSPMTGITDNSISSLFSDELTLGLKRYEKAVKEANNQDFKPPKDRKDFQIEGFRLSPTDVGPNLSIISPENQPSKYSNRLLTFWDKKQVVENIDPNIQTYPGGPGSILGVGNTYIKFADQRTGVNNLNVKNSKFATEGYSAFGRQTTTILSNPTQNLRSSNINYINAVPSGSAKGASSTYASIQGGQPVENEILYNVNQRKDTYDFNVYNTGSLTPNKLVTDFKSFQTNTPPKINFTGSVPSGSIKGASSTYASIQGGQPVKNNIDYKENLRGATYNFSVYNTGSLTPNKLATDFKSFQYSQSFKINYTGSFPKNKGASFKYKSLSNTLFDNGINYEQNTINFTPSVYQLGNFNSTTRLTDDGSLTFTQGQLIKQNQKGNIQDFRQILISGSENEKTSNGAAAKDIKAGNSSIMSIAPNYKDYNIEKRLNLGDPGKSNKNVLSYTARSSNDPITNYGLALDKITAGNIYNAPSAEHVQDHNEHAGNDLVKFSIGVIQNKLIKGEDGKLISLSNFMHFRAFIDSFSDSYVSNWNDYNYVGRGDKFYNYTGFERTINLSFTVFAQSKAELIPMYKKLNYLASSLAPDYSDVGGFMKGNLHKMTIGGYLFEQVGIIKSLTYDIPEETPWEIGINDVGGLDNNVKELPHMIKVTNLTFVPIQHFLPRVANIDNQKNTRYIALSKNVEDNYSNYEPV